MSPTQKTARILIIDPTDEAAAWQTGLENQAQLEVKHLSGALATPKRVLNFDPDLIILHATLPTPPAHTLLADLQAHEVDIPVVLVGPNGEMSSIDFDYPHLIGWISYPFNGVDLDVLIKAALQRSLPDTELILAKRAELAEANRKLTDRIQELQALSDLNAKLYEETQRFSRNLQLVNEVSQLVSRTLDIDQIPGLLLNRTARLVGAECGSLALISRERNGVVFRVAYDGRGQEIKGLKDFLMPLGQGIVGVVAQTGQPIIANDAQHHPAWSPLPDQMTGFTTRKLIAVPLIIEGEILGVIELLNKKDGDFTPEDRQLLSMVASAAASAIQNGRQYAALKQANQALQEAYEQQIAAERWTVLGKAAASLAHRINNSTALVPIAAQHTLELLKQVKMPAELRQKVEGNLDRIARNSLYTVELASDLLRRFSRNPREARDINALIERALTLVDIPANVKVVRHLDPGLSRVETSDLLVDVFVELITNAVRAIGQKEGLLRIATFQASKQKVSIQFTDNGPGISAENIERIFNMFYTTNPSGLGFGLWWVKTFLEHQQGEIAVESQLNEHTTFTVTLLCNQSPLHSQPK